METMLVQPDHVELKLTPAEKSLVGKMVIAVQSFQPSLRSCNPSVSTPVSQLNDGIVSSPYDGLPVM
jgi:hypothetical protein